MEHSQSELGLIGLGVMGRNFLQNLADHGHKVAGYDQDSAKSTALRKESGGKLIGTADSVAGLIQLLRRPRVVLMLVPAGAPVDSVIHELLPHLEAGDLIIDGGNSHFSDTDLRMDKVREQGLAYLGVGISGGEYGARHGPSIMPGGSLEAYQRVAPLLEDAAAKVDDKPCVTYLGPGSAGHYVKMVHNGIEYGMMQLIAEAYDLMKRGLQLTEEQIADTFQQWNEGELGGYLVEITSRIFRREDPRTDEYLIDMILDEARQKGTGMWSSQDAMELQVPVPTIDMAVAMRNLSAMKGEREEAFRASSPDPYETLLWDVIIDDATLFMRADQVEAAWSLLMPILDVWTASPANDFPNYNAGTWGPEAAEVLIAQDGRGWLQPTPLRNPDAKPRVANR